MCAVHVILVWACKGKNCKQYHLAKYLGEKDELAGETMRFKVPGNAVLVHCPKCREQHLYQPKELRTMEMDSPPPAGYQEILGKFAQ